MRLRSPAELYIKYLLSSPENFTDEAIKEILAEKDLDFIDEKYILRLRERIHRPLPFRPNDKLHQASRIFILKEGLFYLYRQDQDMKLAFRILDTPRAKEFIETMILSHAPDAAIAAELARSYRIAATPVSVERYRRFFWNIDLLDSTQMRALLTYRAEAVGDDGATSTKEERAMKAAVKKASWLDSRRIAGDLPHSPMVALMAQMRMGLMPGRLELAHTLRIAQTVAAVRVAEATLYGGERDSHKALNFSIVTKTMGEVLETVVKPDEALRQDLERISLKTDARAVPSIHQLSDGHHTVELTPKDISTDGSSQLDPMSLKKWAENSGKLKTIQLMFREVNDATGENSLYTTFKGEFAMDAGDIIFHFYKTPEVRLWSPVIQHQYWVDIFPTVLEPVALAHFAVTVESGRLEAQHVFDEEMRTNENEPLDSWWLRAHGFGQLLEPHKFALRFCERLDGGLDAALSANGLALPISRT